MSKFLSSLLMPPVCACCGELIDITNENIPFCPKCQEIWQQLTHSKCKYCNELISECKCNTRFNVSYLISSYLYLIPYPTASFKKDEADEKEAFSINTLYTLKRNRHAALISFLASQLATRIHLKFKGDFIIAYPPRNKRAISQYGYDHAYLLAKECAKILNFPLFSGIKRKYGGVDQKTLAYAERGANAFNSYRISKKHRKILEGKNVILIDDVVTSGATSVCIAALLKQCGAEHVVSVSVAKTVKENKHRKI